MSSRSGETLGDAGALGGGQGTVQTRIYKGRTIDEVIPLIQRELGADAIIVRRREGLSGGVLGFFQHPYVEIEAMPGGPRIDIYDEDEPPDLQAPETPAPPLAAPPPPPAPAAPPAPAPAPPPQAARPAEPPFYMRQPGEPAAATAYLSAHLAALARERPPPPPRERPAPPAAFDFQELLPRPAPAPRPPAPPAVERRSVAPGSHSRARAGVERSLLRVGITEKLARELIDGASAHTLPLAPRLGLAQAVRTTLAQRIPVAPALPVQGAAIVLVGAGGAGKTTCSAALLGAYRSGSTLPASFATLTRERTTGELQMILSPALMKPVPASGPRALRALRKARSTGLALIDTPPLSPSDRAQIRELAALLAKLAPERILLALPATLGARAASQLLSALVPLGANSLVVTHADETDQLGVAVEAACDFGLAPEYILERARSGGWRVSRIDPSALAGRLLQ